MCHTQNLGSTTKVKVTVQSQRFVIYRSCVHNNSISAEVNLIKFHTMVKHNEKICQVQNLGSQDEGQGHMLKVHPLQSCIHNNLKGLSKSNQISKKGKLK